MVRTIGITVLFNSLIAVILSIMVLKQQIFFHVFVISQLIGLSICICVLLFDHILENSQFSHPAWVIGPGLMSGIISGSILSWIFIRFFVQASPGFFFSDVFSYVAVFGLVFGLPITYYFFSQQQLINSYRAFQEEKIKRLNIEKEAAMTSLRLLQAQIEPHFLFNTLSNVASLIDADKDKAQKMLLDLNAFLRSCIQLTRQEMITLGQELRMIEHYLNIFKVRLGSRMEFEVKNNTGRDDLPFPPMLIQPLVENSIKYGIEPRPEGGNIRIICSIKHKVLEICIADNGLGLEANISKAGIGIDNVSRRLDSIYGDQASLVLEDIQAGGTMATIKVRL